MSMMEFIKSVCFSAALLLSICGALGADRGQVVVPSKLTKSGLWLVKVSVNGKPAWMLFDTGANTSTINSSHWHLPVRYSGEFTVSAWGGDQHESIPLVVVGGLRIGETDYKAVQLQYRNLSNLELSLGERIDGILGGDLIAGCGRVSIDYQKRVIVMEK
jgi:hypothetical protein